LAGNVLAILRNSLGVLFDPIHNLTVNVKANPILTFLARKVKRTRTKQSQSQSIDHALCNWWSK
jgi:hypothetical protein